MAKTQTDSSRSESAKFDLDATVEALRGAFPEAEVSVEPSAVSRSPYKYVYAYLTDRKAEGPYVLLSDRREWEDVDGWLVGAALHYEAHMESEDAADLEEALGVAQEQAEEVLSHE